MLLGCIGHNCVYGCGSSGRGCVGGVDYLKNLKSFRGTSVLTVNFRQPSHEFTFNVGIDLLL
jgi:hypothetical protein